MNRGGDKPEKPSPGQRSTTNVFDMRQLRKLIRLMEDHDLAEINLRQGKDRVQLRRGGAAAEVNPALPSAPPAQPKLSAESVDPAPQESAHLITINAPMVGTFYARPNPSSEPFVKVGQRIGADTVVCIIEAMKVFNEIPAEVSGQIVAVMVEDQQAVDFGRPLFKVDTSA